VMPLFTTPHGVDLAAVVRAFGVACVETIDASETARAVAAALTVPGATIVRAVVDPHDARDAFAALVHAVDSRLAGGST
jgi:2-succinyl-5-enolpyruvyl-6-hydroxy-3-cyclohexene-1-carboxylate synthase